jgi:hypothetical protein
MTTISNTATGDATPVLVVDLTDALGEDEEICGPDYTFVALAEDDGDLTGDLVEIKSIEGKVITLTSNEKDLVGKMVFVDYYVVKDEAKVDEMQIDAEHFAGYYYVEADTLFRRQKDGVDLPANLTFPNVKIQSNFTFTMASTGDPSTFTFTMDAFPGYTYFDKTKKVLCVMQVIDPDEDEDLKAGTTVMDSHTAHAAAAVVAEG